MAEALAVIGCIAVSCWYKVRVAQILADAAKARMEIDSRRIHGHRE